MTQETYTRDSDGKEIEEDSIYIHKKSGKKFKASLCAHFMQIGERVAVPLYLLEPIEENPMPEILLGDYFTYLNSDNNL